MFSSSTAQPEVHLVWFISAAYCVSFPVRAFLQKDSASLQGCNKAISYPTPPFDSNMRPFWREVNRLRCSGIFQKAKAFVSF